jgi:putative ABC transport system permease protein
MFRVMLRNAAGHKLRLILTALAVILGVAFVAGTFILTDAIKSTFNTMTASHYANIAVVIRGTETLQLTMENSGSGHRRNVPLSAIPTVHAVPGVAQVTPAIEGNAILVGSNGTAVRNAGAPTLGISSETLSNSNYRLSNGKAPENDDQIVVEKGTLEKSGLHVNDTTTVVVGGGVHTFTIVGEFAHNEGTTAGATMIMFSPNAARRYLAPDDTAQTLEVTAAPGVSDNDLRERIAQVIPAGTEAVTGKQQRKDMDELVSQITKGINMMLLIFAFIALFVGAFIIFNTFVMLVGQRAREMALLRALGASKLQVTTSVLGESLIVGLIGSTLGLGLGVLIALLLKFVMSLAGLKLTSDLSISLRTIVVTYVVGVVVTMAAALLPAWRAGRASPVQVMSGVTDQTSTRAISKRTVVAALLLAAGIGLIAWGFTQTGNTKTYSIGIGALITLLAALGVTSAIVRPFSALFAWLYQIVGGPVGVLARKNALRNPRRTSATAAALTIGVTLVCAMSVFVYSAKASFASALEDRITADFFLNAGNAPMSQGAIDAVRALPQVDNVWSVNPIPLQVNGESFSGTSVRSASEVEATVKVKVLSGSLQSLDAGQVVINQETASSLGWQVGQTVTADLATLQNQPLTIGGIVATDKLFGSAFLIPQPLYQKAMPSIYQSSFMALIKAKPGADLDQLRRDITAAVKPFIVITVYDSHSYINEMNKQVNQFLGIIIALLGMSIVIAVLGIINTLALSTFERTREIGLLRSIGTTRMQVRFMIYLESVLITLLGAVMGMIMGIGFGIVMQRMLVNQGITELKIPYLILVISALSAIVVGVIAALWPSERAARLNVLNAITTE